MNLAPSYKPVLLLGYCVGVCSVFVSEFVCVLGLKLLLAVIMFKVGLGSIVGSSIF